jgi:hypothetical protein
LQVRVGAAGFEEKARERTTDVNGLVVTQETFNNVAFARVRSGGADRALLPVEIIDDRVIVCRLGAAGATADEDQLRLQGERWVRRAAEGVALGSNLVAELNVALEGPPEKALELARRAVKALQAEWEGLDKERVQLGGKGIKLDLTRGVQLLQVVHDQREQMDKLVGRLEAILKEDTGEETRALKALAERARLKEGEADYSEAIKMYQAVLDKRPEESDVAARLKKLKAAWETDDAALKQARAFIYDVWPTLTVAGLKEKVGEARKAFEVCRDKGDRLAPRKLVRVNVQHATALQKRLSQLRWEKDTEDSRAETKALVRAAEALARLHQEATAFLSKGKE